MFARLDTTWPMPTVLCLLELSRAAAIASIPRDSHRQVLSLSRVAELVRQLRGSYLCWTTQKSHHHMHRCAGTDMPQGMHRKDAAERNAKRKAAVFGTVSDSRKKVFQCP